MICGLLARKTGRPVRLINSREEEFQASPSTSGHKHLSEDGIPKGWDDCFKDTKVVNDNGAYSAKAPATTA